jgi:RNA polymerase sigma-54 factor
MRLDVSLQQKLQLKLTLAPQIIQSIEILQLPALDLKEMIDQELSENETLEIQEEREETPETALDEANREAHENDEYEQMSERLESMLGDESWDLAPRRNFLTEDGKDRKLEALQNTASRPPGLQDSMIAQLTYASIPERLLPLVRAIIYSLDESGYLLYSLDDVTRVLNSNVNGELPYDEEEAEQALRLVQELEPRGVGARDIQESLLLQIEDSDPRADVKRRLIGGYLEDVNKNRLPKVARDMGLSIEEISALVEEVKLLNPRPGSDIAAEDTHYISPDVVVEYVDGEYEVRLEDDYFAPRPQAGPEGPRAHQEEDRVRPLADRLHRAAPEHAAEGGPGDHPAPARLPRLRHHPPASPEDAGDRGRTGHPRLHGLPGHLRQVPPVPPRHLPAEVLLHGGHRDR